MAYMALYREWRPRTFGDVVGQEHVTITLKNQINSERIAHAYLLCGTRGTGKTSTAKILAKAVNCLNSDNGEPCNECEMCKKINAGTAIDVTELDAASHNGVDNIRDIIEDVQYPPQEAKYKVYIIDEVHMLSIGAVNAFLKTLEEPPSNIIFILATTDPQKLPITILSRCQRFDFKRIKSSDIFDRLRKIVTEQGVFAEDNSLKLISRISDGAMRDALSILDQAISMNGGRVEYDNVVEMLGLVTNESLIKLSDSIIDRNIETSIKGINNIVSSGKDIYVFIKDMTTHMRNLLMVKVSDDVYDILDMSSENIEILKKQAAKIRVEEIMRNIKILQDAEQQAKWSKQNR
ncbi:DNA polymerase III subunit gamma/tau, partial [Clostridium sp.]|uniref:DNA polymerase III subunit gamma/tau n=1 Tax=Clostridium sp. TaxID=1506 RepID=UPI002602A788